MFSYEIRLIFWQLLLYGVHIGHSFNNSSFYAGWLIFTYNYSMYIINLYKTILGFKNGNVGYDFCCKMGYPVWFINLNRAFEIYVNDSALKCGEFAYTTYWIHGMISNWVSIGMTMNKLAHYTEDAHKAQFGKLEFEECPWLFSRWTWPRSACISSVATSEWPSKECLTSRTSSVGIIDTSISGHISNIPTPGNDDSLDCMIFYNSSTSQYILEKKYMHVAGWWNHIKKWNRQKYFSKWVLINFITKDGKLNLKKVYALKKKREIEEKMSDFMAYCMKFKMNVMENYANGVKFFFASGSGDSSFYASLDLYNQNNLTDSDEYDYLYFIDILKSRSFILCKYLNFYFVKGLWHTSSSRIVRKKYMSQKWFKFRFLTRFYKKKVWFDDFFDTNFLVNRFWRNRIYKTYLRRAKYRNNIFVLRFFKFFVIYNYCKVRGFMDLHSSNFMRKSFFSKVSFMFAFNYFKKHHYTSIFKFEYDLQRSRKLNVFSFLYKWLFFKKQVKIFLSRIVYLNKLNKNVKFMNIFKIFSLLKVFLKKRVYLLYSFFNFYFSFWYWNRKRFLKINRQKKFKLIKWFRALKKVNMFFNYIRYYRKCFYFYSRIKKWYLYDLNDTKVSKVMNFIFPKILNVITWQERNITHFSKHLKHRYSKISFMKRYFKKIYKKNRRWIRHNLMILSLNLKHHKFKKTKEVQDKVKTMYKDLIVNKYIYFFNHTTFSRKRYQKFHKYMITNNNKTWGFNRLLKFKMLKYNLFNYNFNTSYPNYNKEIEKDFDLANNFLLWNHKFNIRRDYNKKLPMRFFDLFVKTRRNFLNWKALNYDVFSKKKRKKLFNYNFYFNKKKKNYKKIIINYIKLKKNQFRLIRNKKKNLLKKKFFKRKIFNLIGLNNSFNYLTFIKYWSIQKFKYFMPYFFFFKLWMINFNRQVFKKKKIISKPFYYLKYKTLKLFIYFYHIRSYTVFQKRLGFLKGRLLKYDNCKFNKVKVKSLGKKVKKIYWI